MNKLKIFFTTVILASIIFFNFNVIFANAQVDLSGTLNRAGDGIYGDNDAAKNKSLPEMLSGVIKIVLGTLGVILICIIIYGGYLWMTAGGDETQVKKAQAWIKNAVIGIVVIMSAYAITNYVMTRLIAASLN